MPFVGFKCTDEEKALLHQLSDGNVSGYVKRKVFGSEESPTRHLAKIEQKLTELSWQLDAKEKDLGSQNTAEISEQLAELAVIFKSATFPPPGQMRLHEAMAVETLLLLRSMATPEKMKTAMLETQRIGYKVFEAKEK